MTSFIFRRRPGLVLLLLALIPIAAAAAGYPVVPAWGGLHFSEPIQVVFAPGETNRAFVAERPGRLTVVRDLGNPVREVVLDLTSRVNLGTPDHGLLSIAFHPRFAQNGFLYAWTSVWEGDSRFLRLLRFTLPPSGPVDPASEVTLLSQPMGSGGHDGGTLLFGTDGYLYLSIGDGDQGSAGAEAIASHQRIDRGFFGGVLRLDVDQRPGNPAPNPHLGQPITGYAIPADNPFLGARSFNGQAVDPAAVRTEFWAVGLRNPFRIAFDGATGELWAGDVGLDTEEEVDVITRGANEGWDFLEGTLPGPRANSRPTGVSFAPPVWQYDHAQGDTCLIGGLVYHGSRFGALQGDYLFADFTSGRIWAAANPSARPFLPAQVSVIASEAGIVALTEQPGTGDLLFANLTRGLIERLDDATTATAAPTLVRQPVSVTVVSGTTVALNAATTAAPAPTYQWFFQGAPLPGATRSTLVLPSTGAASAGSYSVLATNSAGSIASAPAVVTVTTTPDPRRVINIATRAPVGTGANILIAGFVIGGTTAKTVLIRGAGPALGAFGVPGTLPDPVLSVFGPSGLLASNSAWGGDSQIAAAAAAVGAFAWADPKSNDAALLLTLPPGPYTAQVAGGSGDTGVALVEVYDVP